MTPDEESAYRAGWLACQAEIGALLLHRLADMPVPPAPAMLYQCTECGGELKQTDVTVFSGSNREGRYLYRHAFPCAPVEPEGPPVPAEAPEAVTQPLAAVTAVVPLQGLVKG